MTKAKIKSDEINIRLNFMVQGLNYETIIVNFPLKLKINDIDFIISLIEADLIFLVTFETLNSFKDLIIRKIN